ncbi:hypothetical protein [Mitsuaria sp. 7]|uniref:hypothetical protein n=1 Tax=Mitsuaria sp. 7 TaxID=1658665 RepID=UPI00083325D6|nr:hypothetical protein [Mitsuaria sp. 7]
MKVSGDSSFQRLVGRGAMACLVALLSLTASAAPSAFPVEVTALVERHGACTHWLGEPGEGDAERQRDIEWGMCQSCPGTDARLAALKKKYRGDPAVMAVLQPLDPQVEPMGKDEAKRFCATTRKPAWAK